MKIFLTSAIVFYVCDTIIDLLPERKQFWVGYLGAIAFCSAIVSALVLIWT